MTAQETVVKINKQLRETREPISADDIEAIFTEIQDEQSKQFWDDCRRQGLIDSEIFQIIAGCPMPVRSGCIPVKNALRPAVQLCSA